MITQFNCWEVELMGKPTKLTIIWTVFFVTFSKGGSQPSQKVWLVTYSTPYSDFDEIT